jgi:pyruvate-formate lyase
MMTLERKVEIMEGFTAAFRKYDDRSIFEREIACLRTQFPAVFLMPEEEDLLAGFIEVLPIGFFPQEGGLGYYCNSEMMQELYNSPEITVDQTKRLKTLALYWSDKSTAFKTRNAYADDLQRALPSDDWTGEPGLGFPLYRMGGSQLDYDKLIQLGLVGLKNEIAVRNNGQSQFYSGLLDMLDLLICCCQEYAGKLRLAATQTADLKRKMQLERMVQTFVNIAQKQPGDLHEAAQLVLLYNFFSGSFSFGRMDEYFGDIYVNDLKEGVSEDNELSVLISFWKIINRRKTIFDGRVIIGGKGRRNPENADRFAKLALRASKEVNDVLPQLTLRFHKDQNPELLKIGLDNIGQGCTFPLLYNDDVNIPSVSNAFQISIDEAEHYVPYGCGEYTIYHRSFGTPSGVINLLKALEMAVHNGIDPIDGKVRGLQSGDFSEFNSFEDFYSAYEKQVEYQVAALAGQEKLEYDICAREAPFLALSLLYDDCIENDKPIFNGGIRFLGGTLETYGNSNTGDSLLAIKKLVFEEKKISQSDLPDILKKNFRGFPKEKAMMQKAPKYGNDLDEEDDMLIRIHDHVCKFTRDQAAKVGLHSYLVVNINNHANTILGRKTHASADGRGAYAPMANANTPSSGQDKNGLTAMLNSIVKPRTDIHAGAVQNIKFSKELFNESRRVVKDLLDTYFDMGGAQAMITVLGKDDLLNAMKHPEKYQNLMVRVGGFSARFVELDRDVQEEILARTMY